MNSPNAIREEGDRILRLRALEQVGLNPYPAVTKRSHSVAEARDSQPGTTVTVAGRLLSKREMGKLTFGHIKDAAGKIQVAFSSKELGNLPYKFFIKQFDVGDFVSVMGEVFVTKKGEITIMAKEYSLLAKALLPLPEKFHGLSDVEIRYRQRYLDLIANEDSMRVAKIRSMLVKELRSYLDERDFFEVETPILQPLYGGANARPFATHHYALDMDLYLRIAPELYLKRLIVGGFEKVYEVARCFRNEGIDQNHNPEFTQIELYWAYANYLDLMNLMEDLLPYLMHKLELPLKFKAEGQEVDFTPPYPRRTIGELIKEYAKVDIDKLKKHSSILEKAKELRVENIDKNSGYGKIVDEIYKKFVRPNIINPIFMIDHPVDLSPLAKEKSDNPGYVERVQLISVGGNELCNGFSELNDPLQQEARFKEQERLRASGDEETMPYDEDFVTALKYGMPPTAGLGIGIDRLAKLLVGADNLKEVILFPTLKPR